MATTSSFLFLLLPLLLLLPAADARPCKTLLISTFSYSLPSSSSSDGDDHLPSLQISASSLTVYRVFRSHSLPALPHPLSSLRHYHRYPLLTTPTTATTTTAAASVGGFPFGSLRERARDIMAVVAALLFGVGCGALTAATVYLAWSLASNRCDLCGADDEGEEEDEIASPKKVGYVVIPSAEPVKEGYEGKN